MQSSLFRYEVFGLNVTSHIPLPELVPDAEQRSPDVLISRGSIDSAEYAGGLHVSGENALLVVPDVGRFMATGGHSLLVEPAPGVSDRNLRLFLLGSAFAAIIHQRGLLPLHANTVIVEGKAIGFLGHSGAGKSTLAAWFSDRGYEVQADDVSVIGRTDDGDLVSYAGIPRLRLWRDALEISGREVDHYEQSFDSLEKYTVPLGRNNTQRPKPLDHLYILARVDDANAQFISQLTGAAAVEALVANTYRGAYVPLMDRTKEHLLACVELAGAVPVFLVRRRWGYDAFDADAQLLAGHARQFVLDGRATQTTWG